MKPLQNETPIHKLVGAGLSALVLGLVLCPFAYMAIGALAGFAPAFSFLTLPPLLVGTGYLFYRFFFRPARRPSSVWFFSLEIASWVLILAFLAVISNFTLLSSFERIGLFFTLFLGTTAVSFPVVLIRQTALRERFQNLPAAAGILLLLFILLPAICITIIYLTRPPAFL